MDASVSTKHRDTLAPVVAVCPVTFAKDVDLQDEDDAVLVDYCGRERLVFVTEDKHIRMKAYYVAGIQSAQVGFIEVNFRNAKFDHKDRVYAQHLDSLCELVRHPVPYCVVLTQSGFRFARLDEAVTRRDGHHAEG